MDPKYTINVLTASLVFICAVPTFARAEVHLSGTSTQLTLEARNATLPEILSGIQSTLNYKVSLTGSTARQFTGTYSGSLPRVLSRLLDGTDNVISSVGGQISIVLSGAGRHDRLRAAAQGVQREQITKSPVKTDELPASDIQGWIGSPMSAH